MGLRHYSHYLAVLGLGLVVGGVVLCTARLLWLRTRKPGGDTAQRTTPLDAAQRPTPLVEPAPPDDRRQSRSHPAAAGEAVSRGLGLGLLMEPSSSDDRWQGRSYPAVGDKAAGNTDVFFLTNTGGGGGAFGRGDIHNHLSDIDFANLQVGYACGYGGVFKSEDGGLTWSRIKPNGGWYHIQAVSPDDVWLLEAIHPGGYGKVWLWHSRDGGKTWSEELKGKLAGTSKFFCRGHHRWIPGGDFTTYRSADGGQTWQPVNFQGLLFGVYDMSVPADVPAKGGQGFTVYVLGHRDGITISHLVRSDDGGRTWQEVPLPEAAQTRLTSGRVFFSTSRDGWVAGRSGRCFVTRDGGRTWKECSLPTDQAISALWFDQQGRGFAAVDNTDYLHFRQAVYMTRDYGATWVPVLGGAKQIRAFCDLGPDHVWAAGYSPGITAQDIVAILKPDWLKP